jgi:hypothetical protein
MIAQVGISGAQKWRRWDDGAGEALRYGQRPLDPGRTCLAEAVLAIVDWRGAPLTNSSQKPLPRVVPKRLRPPVMTLERLDSPVPRHVHDLEEVGTMLERRRDKARTQ